MKRKGFTLIELLAVIMVLAIIALISAPIILKVIEKAEKGSFEDSAYAVADAAKIYYANLNLDEKGKEETFAFPEDTKLKLSGKKPAIGSVRLEEDGKVALAISNGKWCAMKNSEEEKIKITDYSVEECELPVSKVCEDGIEEATPESCFTVNESGDTITGYTCSDKQVAIPSKINDISITSIGDRAFQHKGLTSVKIPCGITYIGVSAFEGSSFNGTVTLVNVNIPSTVTTIGSKAFYYNMIQSVEIPDSVTSIGDSAFHRNQITNLTIGKGIKSISYSCFSTNKLTHVGIPKNVKIIGIYAFNNNNLNNVVIENGVTNIENYAFSFNKLTGIEIPKSVTSIGTGAFQSNQGSMKVTIHKQVDSITGSPWGAASVEWVG